MYLWAGFTSGVVVVAMGISLKGLAISITKPATAIRAKSIPLLTKEARSGAPSDLPPYNHTRLDDAAWRPPRCVPQKPLPALAFRSIIPRWGPSLIIGCGATTDLCNTASGNGSKSVPRWSMTPGLLWLLIVWGALTAVLIILLIYRSTLTMQEDDQLFLDESASAMAKGTDRAGWPGGTKITPLVNILGATS